MPEGGEHNDLWLPLLQGIQLNAPEVTGTLSGLHQRRHLQSKHACLRLQQLPLMPPYAPAAAVYLFHVVAPADIAALSLQQHQQCQLHSPLARHHTHVTELPTGVYAG